MKLKQIHFQSMNEFIDQKTKKNQRMCQSEKIIVVQVLYSFTKTEKHNNNCYCIKKVIKY